MQKISVQQKRMNICTYLKKLRRNYYRTINIYMIDFIQKIRNESGTEQVPSVRMKKQHLFMLPNSSEDLTHCR